MYSNRMDLGFPMALVEFLARLGSVMSITLLVLLFQAEAHLIQAVRTSLRSTHRETMLPT